MQPDTLAGKAACDRCVELFNKAAGQGTTYLQASDNPDRPGYGVPVGLGEHGTGNSGAENIEAVRLGVFGQGPNASTIQGRLAAEEIPELQAMLSQAQAEADDWHAGGPL